MYIANSLIEAGGARYRPGDIVPRLDDIESLIALGFVVVAAGGAEEYAEPEREAAETEQECPETVTEGSEPEQECPGDEEPEEAEPVQESAPPIIGRQSQQGKKFGRKK